MGLYEQDFLKWTESQVRLLKSGAFQNLDIPHLIEEIESMGKSQKRELLSRLAVLIAHLLKIRHQPSRRSKSWISTITTQRNEIELLLEDNPSLRTELAGLLHRAYYLAVKQAAAETGLKPNSFPTVCPFSLEEIFGASEAETHPHEG